MLKLELEDLMRGVSNYDEQIKGVEVVASSLHTQIDQLTESLNTAKVFDASHLFSVSFRVMFVFSVGPIAE